MPQSLSNLLVHTVFSTAGRRPFLADRALREETHHYLGGVANVKGAQSLGVGGVEDHVHMLIVLPRTLSIADLIRDLKRGSSLWIKDRDPAVADFAWQSGYGAFSVGQTETDIVLEYIRHQEDHHRVQTFQEEYRAFLNKYGIKYDERYVWD